MRVSRGRNPKPERHKTHQWTRRRAAGLCGLCGKRPPVGGSMCAPCTAKERKRQHGVRVLRAGRRPQPYDPCCAPLCGHWRMQHRPECRAKDCACSAYREQ